jgi:hypothetical protein
MMGRSGVEVRHGRARVQHLTAGVEKLVTAKKQDEEGG